MSNDYQTSYELRQYRLRDGFVLPELIRTNQDVLSVDFPNLRNRHKWWPQSIRTIKGVQSMPNLRGYTIRSTSRHITAEVAPNSITLEAGGDTIALLSDTIGAASIMLSSATTTTGEVIQGINFAGWLDRSSRSKGIATRVGTQLLANAIELSIATNTDAILTVVRPENEAAVHVVQGLGLEMYGAPKDYADDMGDRVHVQRQLFVASVADLQSS